MSLEKRLSTLEAEAALAASKAQPPFPPILLAALDKLRPVQAGETPPMLTDEEYAAMQQCGVDDAFLATRRPAA